MKKITLIFVLNFYFLYLPASAQTWNWAEGINGSLAENVNDLIIDEDGNLFITGKFSGTSNFDGIDRVSNGGTDIFIAKYDTDGNGIWINSYGGSLDDEGIDLALDVTGNIVVLATFSDSLIFGAASITAIGGTDVAVLKLDTNGNPISVFTDGGVNDDEAHYIAVDQNNKVILSGHAIEGMSFQDNTFPPDPTVQFFIAKYESNGDNVWLEISEDGSGIFGGFNNIRNVEVDSIGNIYVFGNNYEAVSFAGLLIEINGLEECFIIKLAPNGTGLWARDINQGEDNRAFDMALSKNGDVFVTGTGDSDVIDFGIDIAGDTITIDPDDFNVDGTSFLARYNSAGGLLWAVFSAAGHVAINNDMQVACSGFDVFNSDYQIYLHDGNGLVSWNKALDLNAAEVISPMLAIDQIGNIYASDDFENDLTFDALSLNNLGLTDVFLGKINAVGLCLAGPSNYNATSTDSSAFVSWDAVQDATSYEYRYRSPSGTWVEGSTTENFVQLSNLTSNTRYEFEARSFCGAYSDFIGFRFKTLRSNNAKISDISENKIELYPNPAIDKIKLQLQSIGYSGTIKIYNKNGLMEKKLKLTKDINTIDIANLPHGIYTMNYLINNEIYRYRFIKK